MSASQRTSTGVTAVVMHTGTISGPARSLEKRILLTTDETERFVYLPGPGPATDLFSAIAKVEVFGFGTLRVPGGPLGAARMGLGFLRDAGRFWSRFRRDGIETVIASSTYTPAAVLAARIARKRVIVACGEIFDQSGDTRKAKAMASRVVVGIVERCADLIVCCSHTVRAQFSDRSNAVVVYPRMETQVRPAGEPTDDQTVVVAGTLNHARGQDVAVRAIALLSERSPALRLLVAGEPMDEADAPFRDELTTLAAEAGVGDRVEMLGFVDDVAALFARATVVVNPCRFDEPFGRVAYESLAAGTPVVLSDTGANTELLRDEIDALIVPPDDPQALADAIFRLVSSTELRAKLVAGAADVLASVDASVTDGVYLDAVRALLERT